MSGKRHKHATTNIDNSEIKYVNKNSSRKPPYDGYDQKPEKICSGIYQEYTVRREYEEYKECKEYESHEVHKDEVCEGQQGYIIDHNLASYRKFVNPYAFIMVSLHLIPTLAIIVPFYILIDLHPLNTAVDLLIQIGSDPEYVVPFYVALVTTIIATLIILHCCEHKIHDVTFSRGFYFILTIEMFLLSTATIIHLTSISSTYSILRVIVFQIAVIIANIAVIMTYSAVISMCHKYHNYHNHYMSPYVLMILTHTCIESTSIALCIPISGLHQFDVNNSTRNNLITVFASSIIHIVVSYSIIWHICRTVSVSHYLFADEREPILMSYSSDKYPSSAVYLVAIYNDIARALKWIFYFMCRVGPRRTMEKTYA